MKSKLKEFTYSKVNTLIKQYRPLVIIFKLRSLFDPKVFNQLLKLYNRSNESRFNSSEPLKIV